MGEAEIFRRSELCVEKVAKIARKVARWYVRFFVRFPALQLEMCVFAGTPATMPGNYEDLSKTFTVTVMTDLTSDLGMWMACEWMAFTNEMFFSF